MPELSQSEVNHLLHRVEIGEITAEEFNILKIRGERVKIIKTRIPQEIRRQYNAAVKRGELGHKKKEGYQPEVYYHPSFSHLVGEVRNRAERELRTATKYVMA